MARWTEPHGGRVRFVLPVAAAVILWAVIAFTVSGLAIPLMDPECYSDIGDRICPLAENRDPDLTHLYESRWPVVSEPWVALILLISIGLAVVFDRCFLRAWDPWPGHDIDGIRIGLTCGTLGVGIGLTAGGAGFTDPRMLLAVAGAGLLACALGGLGIRAIVHR